MAPICSHGCKHTLFAVHCAGEITKCEICKQEVCQRHLPRGAHECIAVRPQLQQPLVPGRGAHPCGVCNQGQRKALFAVHCKGPLAECQACGQLLCQTHIGDHFKCVPSKCGTPRAPGVPSGLPASPPQPKKDPHAGSAGKSASKLSSHWPRFPSNFFGKDNKNLGTYSKIEC